MDGQGDSDLSKCYSGPMDTRVPRQITPEIRALSEAIVPGGTALFVSCDSVSDADLNDCFPIVEDYVRANGGAVCIGWGLWEWPRVMVEAEFHATWRSPSGGLLDIVPRILPLERILFLPDPSREYTGVQVDNIRRATSKDPFVGEFIEVHEQKFGIMNRGSRALEYGAIALEGAEATEWQELMVRAETLLPAIRRAHPLPGRNDPCFCGTEKKYKRCCGP